MKRLSAAMVVLALVASFSYAQTSADKKTGKETQPRRDQLRKRIHTVRMVELVNELDLDEQKAVIISKLLKEYETKQDDLGKQRRTQTDALRQLVASGKADDTAVRKGIEAILDNENALRELNRQEFKDLAEHLTPTQQAKYLLFRQEFNRAVGDVLRRGGQPRTADPGQSASRSGRDRRSGRDTTDRGQ